MIAVGDGLSLIQIGLSMFTDENGNRISLPPPKSNQVPPKEIIKKKKLQSPPSPLDHAIDHAATTASTAYKIASTLIKVSALPTGEGDTLHCLKDPYHPYKYEGNRVLFFVPPISLSCIKSIKNVLKCSVNDVLTGALAGAYSRYMTTHSDPSLQSTHLKIRALLPYAFPRDLNSTELTNSWAFLSVGLPVQSKTPKQRVLETKKIMDDVKSSPEPYLTIGLQKLAAAVMSEESQQNLIVESMTKHRFVTLFFLFFCFISS